MATWSRNLGASNSWPTGSSFLTSIPTGSTLLRVRFRWGFYGDSATTTNLQAIAQNLLAWGLVTTVGNGTETPPNARTQATDQAPPTQRWLYWEASAPEITAIDDESGVVTWQNARSTEPTSTRGQVAASGIPAGQTLNLWASWAAASAWDPSGQVSLWVGAATLHK